jgi:hypothetical protein
MNELTQEERCELNNIRHEIEKMEKLTESEKLKAVSAVLRSVLEFYASNYTLATARYQLECCRSSNMERL